MITRCEWKITGTQQRPNPPAWHYAHSRARRGFIGRAEAGLRLRVGGWVVEVVGVSRPFVHAPFHQLTGQEGRSEESGSSNSHSSSHSSSIPAASPCSSFHLHSGAGRSSQPCGEHRFFSSSSSSPAAWGGATPKVSGCCLFVCFFNYQHHHHYCRKCILTVWGFGSFFFTSDPPLVCTCCSSKPHQLLRRATIRIVHLCFAVNRNCVSDDI